MNKLHPVLLASASILMAAESLAQVPTTLLKAGDLVDWQGQSRVVVRVGNPNFNGYGARGVAVELASPAIDPEIVYWGSRRGEARTVLRGASTIGGIEQRYLDLIEWGFNAAGETAYYAAITASGFASAHTSWVGDTLIVRGGDPVPGMVDRFFGDPGSPGFLATTGGGPVFASILRTGAGVSAGYGLFQGSPPATLLLSGASIPGLSRPVSQSIPIPLTATARFVDVSPDGSHWCAAVALQGEDGLVLDGVAAMANGLPVETGSPVPASVASQATWSGITDVSVDDQGRWTALLRYRFAAGGSSRAIFRDGVPIVPLGVSVGGVGPITSIHRVVTSRSGRLAFVVGASGPKRHLIVGRRLAISVGDAIDYTGDGVVDPGYTLDRIGDSFGGIAVDDDGTVWLYGRINLPSGAMDSVLLEVAGYELGVPFCSPAVANTTGAPARIGAAGHAVAGGLPLTLRATDLPPNCFGYFLASTTTAIVPMAGGSQGTLCLGGNIGRFNAQIVNSGTGGTFEIDVDTTNIPGLPPSAVQPGDTWTFQGWHRDANPTLTSNLTDAVQVTFD